MLYQSAGLRRPVTDLAHIERMYASSPLVITAWDGDSLVGILRGWTDGAYDGYVCDLAIHAGSQKTGIGRALLEQIRVRYPDVQWLLLASLIAKDYYAHLGWKRVEHGWHWPRPEWK